MPEATKEKVNLSLKLLILNDLLRMEVIGKELYDMAVQKLSGQTAASGDVSCG